MVKGFLILFLVNCFSVYAINLNELTDTDDRRQLVTIRTIGNETNNSPHNNFLFGVGAGNDYILFGNIYAFIEYYVLNGTSFGISLHNKIGAMFPWALICYDYPSIKLHKKIFKLWLSLSFGREYTYMKSEYKNCYQTIDYRIDLGLRTFTMSNFPVEVSIPIRVDDELPIYWTGINFTVSFELTPR